MENNDKAGFKLGHVFDTLLKAVELIRGSVPNILSRQEKLVQQALERSRWHVMMVPPDAQASYQDIHERSTIYVNTVKRTPGDDMVELMLSSFDRILRHKQAEEISNFLSPATDTRCFSAAECFTEMRRLVPLVEGQATADLDSPARVLNLNAFLLEHKAVWTSESFKRDAGKTLHSLVSTLIKRLGAHRQVSNTTLDGSLLVASDTASIAGSSHSGLSHTVQVAQLTMVALADPAFIQLEDRLLAYQLQTPPPQRADLVMRALDERLSGVANLPWWYQPIRDITISGVAIAIKHLLGVTKSLPCKSSQIPKPIINRPSLIPCS